MDFDAVIIGSSIYSHHLEKEVLVFLKENEAVLFEKSFALFVCGVEYEIMDKVFQKNIPKKLRQKVLAIEKFGGVVHLEAFGWYDR